MKRLLTITLSIMMMLALCVPAFATEEDHGQATTTNDGKITINNAAIGETYTVYQLAVLESFSGTSYSYWLNETWRPFFQTEAAKKYFNVSEEGYLTTTSNVMQDANKKKMVEDALAYIVAKGIAPTDSIVAESNTVVFENLNLGYYLVDTTLGTVCSVDTTAKEVVISDKNSGPTITKEVQEDSGTAFGHTNDADLFQPMQFRMILDGRKGAVNYVVHDTMTNMTFDAASVEIYVGAPLDDKSNILDAANYTLTENVDCGEGTCSFHIAFAQAFLDTMTDSTDLYIYYKAALTADAVIGGTGNPNDTYISYGNAQKSTHDTTTTYTYEFDMVKTDDAGKYIGGATFTLWDSLEGGNRIELVKEADGTYRIAKEGETPTVIELADGKTNGTISGLDGRTTYYLQEEAAPEGYNRLTARKPVSIANASLKITPDDNQEIYSGSEGGIQVINKTGAVLPSTGGFGTTMFVVIGTVLALGAGVLLVTKTRMAKFAD